MRLIINISKTEGKKNKLKIKWSLNFQGLPDVEKKNKEYFSICFVRPPLHWHYKTNKHKKVIMQTGSQKNFKIRCYISKIARNE